MRWSLPSVPCMSSESASATSLPSTSSVYISSASSMPLRTLIVSDEAVECVGRMVGSSSVDPSKSVSASLASEVEEYELIDRR